MCIDLKCRPEDLWLEDLNRGAVDLEQPTSLFGESNGDGAFLKRGDEGGAGGVERGEQNTYLAAKGLHRLLLGFVCHPGC